LALLAGSAPPPEELLELDPPELELLELPLLLELPPLLDPPLLELPMPPELLDPLAPLELLDPPELLDPLELIPMPELSPLPPHAATAHVSASASIPLRTIEKFMCNRCSSDQHHARPPWRAWSATHMPP
jgi:hypothetical protein